MSKSKGMVDITAKEVTVRTAKAAGVVLLEGWVLTRRSNKRKKGL